MGTNQRRVAMTDPQLTLPIEDLVIPVFTEGMTIQARFESFHEHNPWVADVLERMTTDRLAAGKRKVGIGMLFEVLRWQAGFVTEGDDFRLNNNYRSRYVRLLIERHPEWAEAFETRELKAA